MKNPDGATHRGKTTNSGELNHIMNRKAKPLPPPAALRAMFEYDPATGIVTWRTRPRSHFKTEQAWKRRNTRFSGKRAGCMSNGNGYMVVRINGTLYYLHRIIHVLVTGQQIPDGIETDHINGDRADNRWSNIRLVTPSANQRNQCLRNDNSSGVVGVYWYKRDSKWEAQIQINGKKESLGRYDTFEEAKAARLEAERRYGFHENHGRKP